jgi:hypothetical protein
MTGRRTRRHGHEPGIGLTCGSPPGVRHVGIVFVHGIGSQGEGETLLDWGGTLVRSLADARVRHDASADPVIDVQLTSRPWQSRYIEVRLPAIEAGGRELPEQHWVMTEAWWANRVRPPSFGQMAEWLGPRGAIRRILEALLVRPAGTHDPRLRPWAQSQPLHHAEDGTTEEDIDHGPPMGMRRAPGNPVLRMLQSGGGGLYLQAVSALLLVIYGVLRSIEKLLPFGPLKDGALTRPLDSFVLDWFGDVYVLLTDSAQAAGVRDRLLDALLDLEDAGCGERVIIAHSGGAIVSCMTLADHGPEEVHVDRLITLGEGLNLAWRLTTGEQGRPATDASVEYDRLYRDVLAVHPDLRWDDFWGSQDPAPVGVLTFPGGTASDGELRERVRSHATWNRLSIGADHGSYWQNDEEFVTPVARLLEGRPDGPGLFGDPDGDRAWSNLRRRRLSMLSLWRQLGVLAPTAAIVLAIAAGTTFTLRAADAVLPVIAAIPGMDVVVRALGDLHAMHLETQDPWRFVAEAGVWIVAAAVASSAVFALKAPPERPLPWATTPRGAWIGWALRYLPWATGVLVSIALVFAAGRFIGGSTPAAVGAGRGLGILVAAVVVIGALTVFTFGASEGDSSVGYVVDAARMIVAMVVLAGLVIAPVVAIVLFPDTARNVLGILVVFVLFDVVVRVGGWRWAVWDERERGAMRAGRTTPGIGRVVVQATFLVVTLALLFLAVVLNAPALAGAAAAAAIALVLVGVSIDVLDSLREDRARPTDGLRRRRSFQA